jgi:DNA-binding NarL/FixJ family response regulator
MVPRPHRPSRSRLPESTDYAPAVGGNIMPNSKSIMQRRGVEARTRPHSGVYKEPNLADTVGVLAVASDSAVRSSLEGVLSLERGIGKIDTVPTAGFAIRRIIATQPRVCLIDYHLGADSGCLLAHRIKHLYDAPSVIVYAGVLDDLVGVAARVATVDGLIESTSSPNELGEIIRRVAEGQKQLPAVTPETLRASAALVDPLDRPLLTMLVNGTPAAEAGRILGLSRVQLSDRRFAILDRLRRRHDKPATTREVAAKDPEATVPRGRRQTMPSAATAAAPPQER